VRSAILILAVIVVATVPPSLARQESPPTFRSDAPVVLLDLVARDAKGRRVSDLHADEILVFEDGKRCEVQSFRLVRASVEGTPSAPAVAAAPSGTTAPRLEPAAAIRANLVVLLFDALYVNTAPYARQAAFDLLGRSFPPDTWFAVYKVYSHGTKLLQPFSADRDRLRAAVTAATTGDEANRPRALPATRPPRMCAVCHAGTSGPPPGGTPPPSAGPPSRSLEGIAAGAEVQLTELTIRVAELASFYGIQGIARSLAAVRGRKAIVYFAEDHELGGEEPGGGGASLVYEAAMSDANRANVTIHTVAARGLISTRVGGRSPFDQVVGQLSAAGPTGGGGAIGTQSWTADTTLPDSGGGPMERRASFLSFKSGSLLEHVAEETGGLAIQNTNDLAAGLARVIDELREYYEVVYASPNPVPDGRFRRIQAKVTRQGVQLRTRAGYFATPATAPTLAAFELTLMAALAESDPPHAFDYEAWLDPHPTRSGDREVEFRAEVPLGAIKTATDEPHGTYTAHLSFLAFVRDETGRAVVRLSQDWPVEGKLDATGRAPQMNLVLRRSMALPVGRYTVDSAIQDRATGRISVVHTSIDLALGSTGSLR